MNEYQQQAVDFLKKADAKLEIRFLGLSNNVNLREKDVYRNTYDFTITTPRGFMKGTFYDSIHNTEISQLTVEDYAKRLYRAEYSVLRPHERNDCRLALKKAQEDAKPNEYDILACLTKYDPETFEDFCSEFGYDEDSRSAEQIYLACVKEYKQLTRIFTEAQMEELREIN